MVFLSQSACAQALNRPGVPGSGGPGVPGPQGVRLKPAEGAGPAAPLCSPAGLESRHEERTVFWARRPGGRGRPRSAGGRRPASASAGCQHRSSGAVQSSGGWTSIDFNRTSILDFQHRAPRASAGEPVSQQSGRAPAARGRPPGRRVQDGAPEGQGRTALCSEEAGPTLCSLCPLRPGPRNEAPPHRMPTVPAGGDKALLL